jgi:hypothetical protein
MKNETKNELEQARARGRNGETIIVRTWFRDINGNSYQGGALYVGGVISYVWPKNYQGIIISQDIKAMKDAGLEFAEVFTATRLKDFYSLNDVEAALPEAFNVSL